MVYHGGKGEDERGGDTIKLDRARRIVSLLLGCGRYAIILIRKILKQGVNSMRT
jgi:hypothetical protein